MTWISRQLKPPTTSAAWCAPSPNRCARPSVSASSTGSRSASTATCGPSSIDADILSAAAPESLGGGGFGVLEQVAVLVALGRQLAAVPYLESAVLAAGALAKFGSEALQQAVGGAGGQRREDPHRRARRRHGRGPGAGNGRWRRLPADRHPHAGRLRPGRRRVPGARRNRFGHQGVRGRGGRPRRDGRPRWTPPATAVSAHLELQGVESGPTGSSAVTEASSRWLTTHGTLGRSAFQLGVLERALELTAEYAREREQFDRPIGSFQAVSSRLADGYIDIKGLRLTLTQAAWRLSEDLPADVDVEHGGVLGGRRRTPGRAHHGARARRCRRSTPTTPCTGTSWRPSRPSSRSAAPPGSCCASAANWPTHLPDPTSERSFPTVTELLAPLVDVDDRGVYFEDTFTSWRDHIRHGAAIAAALRASPGSATPAACRGAAGEHPVLLRGAGRGGAVGHRAGRPEPDPAGRGAAARHRPCGLPTGAGRLGVGSGPRSDRPSTSTRVEWADRDWRPTGTRRWSPRRRARRPVHADLHLGHQR